MSNQASAVFEPWTSPRAVHFGDMDGDGSIDANPLESGHPTDSLLCLTAYQGATTNTDCDDTDCGLDPICQQGGAETLCVDGVDNDGNGYIDDVYGHYFFPNALFFDYKGDRKKKYKSPNEILSKYIIK